MGPALGGLGVDLEGIEVSPAGRRLVLRVVVDIQEVDVPLMKEKLAATVRVQSIKDRDFQGKISRLANGDSVTGSESRQQWLGS